ncbi:MAG: methyl-accepting chemotaxis protein [Thermodesulfobacteriota bacterium]
MAWFNKLSTRAKLLIGFGAMWLLLAAVIAVAYWNMASLAQSEKEIHDVGLVKVLNLQKLRAHENHNRAEILEMTLATKRAQQAENEKNIRKRAAEADEMMRLLLTLEQDPRSRGQLQELKAIMAQYRTAREQQIALIYQGKMEEARQLAAGVQDQRYQKIWEILADLGQRESARLAKIIEMDVQQAKGTVQVFVILGIAAFLLGLVMVLVLNRITAEISQAVSQLGSAASEIMTATTQVASGSAETAAAISQTTTTVEEVRQAAQLTDKKAKDVSAGAQGVAQVAQTGKGAVDEVAAGIQRIRAEMESIAKTIVFLSEQGQSIGGIIATVTDLADQSNLLAVNAAIEAAKAGEQGKGFAVVAQEIKSLAEQSKQATSQVRTILGDIQKATSAAVMATEQGSKAVEAGARQSAQAGEAIRALAESTTEAAQAATQIAVSGQQQVVGMDQVGVAMESINQAGAETAASMKQVETAAHNLNELGQNLKRLVARYKV